MEPQARHLFLKKPEVGTVIITFPRSPNEQVAEPGVGRSRQCGTSTRLPTAPCHHRHRSTDAQLHLSTAVRKAWGLQLLFVNTWILVTSGLGTILLCC